MKQDFISCEFRCSTLCAHCGETIMQELIKATNDSGGFIKDNGRYELADKICTTCSSFKLNQTGLR
jgi:hypothetical protein